MKQILSTTFYLLILSFLSACGGAKLPKGVIKESFIHKYGVAMSKGEWLNRGSDGKVLTQYENGVSRTRTYQAGKLHGESSASFAHSSVIEKKQVYKEGNLQKEILHYTSGVPMWEKKYLEDGKSILTSWYEDGSPQSLENYVDELLEKGAYYTLNNELEASVDQKEGSRLIRDPFGNLLAKDLIKDGQLVLRTTYHPNGDPKVLASYQDGVIHGKKKTYWMGGEPNTIEEWNMGKQEGLTKIFQNGKVKASLQYLAGQRHGVEKRFNDQDVLVEEIYWIEDQRHGPSRNYIGDKTNTKWFHQGKVVSKFVFDEFAR